jgi:RNA recognition motif-containing protein
MIETVVRNCKKTRQEKSLALSRKKLDMSIPSDYQGSDCSSYRPYCKLFVGCISYDADEDSLRPIFESFGDIVEFTIQRDREGRSRGCAWLKYTTQDACKNCIATLSNKYYVNGMRSPIVVKYANTQDEGAGLSPSLINPPISKLFVGGFPTSASEGAIRNALEMFGAVTSMERLSRMGVPTGPVFVTYADNASAQALLNANTATIFMTEYHGSTVPVSLRVSAAFSPVREVHSAPSIASQGSSESPVHRNRPPSVIYPSSAGSSMAAQTKSKLFVGCLPYSRTSTDLSDLFSQVGPLVEVALLTTPEGKSKGAAFVTYVNKADAERALVELQGYCFPNSSRGINISFATKQGRPGALPLGSGHSVYQGSPVSSSAATYAPMTLAEEPTTPPGFTPPGYRESPSPPQLNSFSSDELLRYISESHGTGSSFSILRRGSEDNDLDKINRDLLSSIFGETNK